MPDHSDLDVLTAFPATLLIAPTYPPCWTRMLHRSLCNDQGSSWDLGRAVIPRNSLIPKTSLIAGEGEGLLGMGSAMSQTTPRPDLLDDVPARARVDRSLALLREGYRFVDRRRREGDGPTPSDRAVELRILGQRAVLLGGREAVRFFHDQALFRRRDAFPRPLANTLFGKGAVHVHDGEAHLHRKAMFMRLLSSEHAVRIGAITDELWRAAVDRWEGGGRVVLFDDAVRVIGVGLCRWAGLPLTPRNAPRRVWDLERIVDGFGSVGVLHVEARLARKRSEHWVKGVVAGVRAGRLPPEPGSALDVVSAFRDVDGTLLDDRTAAVELLNMVRPAV